MIPNIIDCIYNISTRKYSSLSNRRLPYLMNPRGHKVTQNAYISPSTHTRQLLLVKFCDITAGIGASIRKHERTNKRTDRLTDGQTDELMEGHVEERSMFL